MTREVRDLRALRLSLFVLMATSRPRLIERRVHAGANAGSSTIP
jgi:hypothetical protein